MREPRLGNVSASCSVENEKGSETIQIAVGPMGLPMGLPMGQSLGTHVGARRSP